MIRRDALDGIHRFGMALGLSPAARARLDVSPQPLPFDELLDGPERLLTQPRDPGRLLR